MRELFPIKRDNENPTGKCKKFLQKYCHPFQIGTGLMFTTIGVGITAVGLMYADGLNFAVQNISDIPTYFEDGGSIAESVDYVRESYKGSMSQSLEAGWKQAPFSYSIGHYTGGKIKDKVTEQFRSR